MPNQRPTLTPPSYAARQKRQAAKRRRRGSLIVLAVMVVVLFVTALLLTGGKNVVPSSSVAPSFSQEMSTPEVVPSVPASFPQPQQSAPQREATPYDEESPPALYNFENPIRAGADGKPDSDAVRAFQKELEASLVSVGGGQQMEPRAAAAFIAMKEAAAADGLNLAPVSGYRTHQRQTDNYNNSIQRYLNQGMSQEEAVERTEGYYAIPGTSEHEVGLAMDIGFIEDSFENTAEFTWLQENAVRFGFILRYRADTFDITRIKYEPWHYRYIGANHAERMDELGIRTLEEYVRTLTSESAMG